MCGCSVSSLKGYDNQGWFPMTGKEVIFHFSFKKNPKDPSNRVSIKFTSDLQKIMVCLWKPFPSTQRTKSWTGTASFCQCKSSLATWLLYLTKRFSLMLTKFSQQSSPLYHCSQIEGMQNGWVGYYVSEKLTEWSGSDSRGQLFKVKLVVSDYQHSPGIQIGTEFI